MAAEGILIVDKPAGLTSHDVVSRVRRVLQTKRVGHAGTLDPDATGVLVVCVGECCRLAEYLTADRKTYEGCAVFGTATDTDDDAGAVTAEKSASWLTAADVERASRSLVGVVRQRVPRVSAVHVAGQRAYQRARRGEDFAPPVREVTIDNLSMLSFTAGELAKARFMVTCSKGTYVRALCRDWGEALGMPAHLRELRRLRSGAFSVQDAVVLERWERAQDPADALLPVTPEVLAMPSWTVPESVCTRLANGQTVTVAAAQLQPLQPSAPGFEAGQESGERSFDYQGRDGGRPAGKAAVFSPSGVLAAIVDVEHGAGQALVRPKKVFWKRGE